jgi:hypothetical protein
MADVVRKRNLITREKDEDLVIAKTNKDAIMTTTA